MFQHHAEGTCHLLLDISLGGINLGRFFHRFVSDLWTWNETKPLFQGIGNLLAPPFLKLIINLLTTTVHPKRHDVDMLTGNVIMFEHDIRLVAITESLHILLGYLCEPFIGEFLVRVRIERTVEHRLLRSAFLWDKCLHIGKHLCHCIMFLFVLIQAMGKKNACFPFLHLFEVIAECPSKVLRCRNFCYHFSN